MVGATGSAAEFQRGLGRSSIAVEDLGVNTFSYMAFNLLAILYINVLLQIWEKVSRPSAGLTDAGGGAFPSFFGNKFPHSPPYPPLLRVGRSQHGVSREPKMFKSWLTRVIYCSGRHTMSSEVLSTSARDVRSWL